MVNLKRTRSQAQGQSSPETTRNSNKDETPPKPCKIAKVSIEEEPFDDSDLSDGINFEQGSSQTDGNKSAIVDNAPATETVPLLPKQIFDDIVGLNPFYTGRLAESKILKGILAVTVRRESPEKKLCDIEILDVLRFHRTEKANRILQISNHQDVVQIVSPKGGIVNMSVADPSKFCDIGGYVCAKEHKSFVVATLTGVCTYFSNQEGPVRQICVKPFFHSWPRFVAVIGSVVGADRLHFRTWREGVVFGTGLYDSRGRKVYHQKGKVSAPIEGAMLPVHEEIPVYDGHEKFSFRRYWSKRYDEEVQPGATVSVLFSIKRGVLPEDAKSIMNASPMVAIYLNILGVVVNAEPTDSFSLDTSPDPSEVHGVDKLYRLKDIEPQVEEASEEIIDDSDVGETY